MIFLNSSSDTFFLKGMLDFFQVNESFGLLVRNLLFSVPSNLYILH